MTKRFLSLLIVVLGLFSLNVYGQAVDPNAKVTLDNVTPLHGPDTIEVGKVINFGIRYTNNTGFPVLGTSTGFRVYSPSGATWDTTILTSTGAITSGMWDGGIFTNHFSADGTGADTVGFAGFSLFGTGLVDGFSAAVANIAIGPIPAQYHGGTICLDSSFFRPTNEWVWSTEQNDGNGVYPTWDGPHCFTIFDPNAPTGANLVVTPDTLNFTATAGGANPAGQNISITSDGTALTITSITDDQPWLSVAPTSGSTPLTPTASVDITGFPAGTYFGNITITSSDALNSPKTVVAKLVINPAPISNLLANPTSLTFNATEGGSNPAGQQVSLTSSNQVLNYSVSDDAPWLTFAPPQGQTPSNVTFSANISGLAAGTYTGTITFTSAQANNSPVTVGVTLNVAAAPSNLVVDPTALSFTATEGGSAPADQFLAVSSDNDPISFMVSDDASWLTVTPNVGTTPESLTVSVNPAGLGAGSYSGTITIESGSAANSPVTVDVSLTVSPAAGQAALVSINPIGTVTGPNTLNIAFVGDNTLFTTGSPARAFLIQGSDTVEGTNVVVSDDTHLTADFVFPDSLPGGLYDARVTYDTASVTKINAFTVTPRAHLTVTPSTLNFTYTPGDPAPGAQSFTLTSDGWPIDYKIAGNDDWVNLSKTFGTTPDSVSVTVNVAGFDSGDYSDTLIITSPSAFESPVLVVVNLHVATPPPGELVISPDSLSFVATEGGSNPANQLVYLTSSDASVLDFSLAKSSTWLTLGATSGNTPESVSVAVDITGLTAGTYYDTVVATSTTASNGPVSTVVILTINPNLGFNSLVIGTAPAVPGAQIVVPVNFVNGCNLVAADFSIEWASEYLTLDSVSYTGSRVEGMSTKNASIDNDANTAHLSVLAANSSEWETPGSGLFASLIFTVSPLAPAGTYDINIFTSVDTPVVNHGTVSIFTLNCGDGPVGVEPNMEAGAVVVNEQPNFTCGYVVDENGDPVAGATVELWTDFPFDGPALTTTTDPQGYYSFSDFTINPFDIYAYKDGYYPDKAENLNFGCYGTLLTLHSVQAITPTYEWVNFYCSGNTYMDAPLPIGSVIEAMDPNGVVCGRWTVTEAGKYGFMPVYRDDAFTDNIDEGALPGDNITFYVNGVLATANGSTTWTQNGDAFEVCLDAGNAVEKTCSLEAGWNLVSWNLDTESDELTDVLASISDKILLVMGFEQGGLTYDPTLPEFSTLSTVDHLSGYWIKVSEAVTLDISGMTVPTTTPIPVTTGWNLVSYLPEDTRSVEDGFASLGDNLLVSLGYDGAGQVYQPNQGDFNTLTELSACHGYWVKVAHDADLTYDMNMSSVKHEGPIATSSAVNKAGVMPTRAWINLYSRDLTVNGQMVTAGTEVAAYTMDGTKVGSFTLKENGKFGFMPVYADDETTGDVVEGVKHGDAFYLTVNGARVNETYTWSQNGDKVELNTLTAKSTGTVLPKNFVLNQNYPNPFNPKTRISFSLPKVAEYTLTIYNITGQKVHEVSGNGNAGVNEIDWDASGQASGVYFYKLTAGAYTDTKKMTLLK